jgi:hypothetical protein
MKSVMYAALGADLAAKISDHNVKVTRPFAVASADSHHMGGQLANVGKVPGGA